MSKQQAPFVVRWRNGVMDDTNPVLTWRALVAAMALTRWADVKTGHNCYPGAKKCADAMRVSVDTIQRGWAELEAAGWIKVHPLPAGRRASQGALKELRWPRHNMAADSGYPLVADVLPADSGPTFPGNQEGLSTRAKEAEAGKSASWPACSVSGCDKAGTVENWSARWCESHATEEYERMVARRPSLLAKGER